MEKIAVFKYVIKEFHEFTFPTIIPRELCIPETKKVISLIGSRRSGKTFYFYQLIQQLVQNGIPNDCILYINFEDDRLLPLTITFLVMASIPGQILLRLTAEPAGWNGSGGMSRTIRQ